MIFGRYQNSNETNFNVISLIPKIMRKGNDKYLVIIICVWS